MEKLSSILKQTRSKPGVYTTRCIDSSLILLDTSEDQVLMEALINLSLYCDHNDSNVIYLWERGLLSKLLNLLDKNICIARLVLNLLGRLVEVREVMVDFDQEAYDDNILKISDTFVNSKDPYISLYSACLLAKIVKYCRIVCLIYEPALFSAIVNIIVSPKSTDALLEEALDLLLGLMEAPDAELYGPELNPFNITNIVTHLHDEESRMLRLCLEVVNRLTYYFPYSFEQLFIDHKIAECMFEVFMNEKMEQYHEIATDTINNFMICDDLCCYLVESLEFLKFCHWVKHCEPKYHYQCIVILEELSRVSARKQLLFNFSVENSIMSLLRSTEKRVLNKVCQGIMNMNTHLYCMQKCLTPALIRCLFGILKRSDEEDPWNEVALSTIVDFAKRAPETIDIIQELGLHNVLLDYFHNRFTVISGENLHGLLRMLFNISLHPVIRRENIMTPDVFKKLLHVLDIAIPVVSRYVCRILANYASCAEFRSAFVSQNGAQVFLNKMKNEEDVVLLQEILLFIHENLQHEDVEDSFLHHNLVQILKKMPETVKVKIPLAKKVLGLIYNHHPSLKFFDTKRLDVTDKLGDKFCLVSGYWRSGFPTLEEFAALPVSPEFTVYIVDYSLNSKQKSATDMMEKGTISSVKTYTIPPDSLLPKIVSQAITYLASCSTLRERVQFLAKFVDSIFNAPVEEDNKTDKIHNIMLHVAFLKYKLCSNLVPIGYLKQGSYCERALLFKALADVTCVPSTLVKGQYALYWNEVPLIHETMECVVIFYVVDLVKDVGNLMERDSRDAVLYCTG